MALIMTHRISLSSLLLVSLFIQLSSTLAVLPSSSCTSTCLADPRASSVPATHGSDVVCRDSQYNSTSNGTKFRDCIDCQVNSAAVDRATGQTDLGWALCELSAQRAGVSIATVRWVRVKCD